MIQNIHGIGRKVQHITEIYTRFHVVHTVTYIWHDFVAGKPSNAHSDYYGKLLE